MAFSFLDPGPLAEGTLELVCSQRVPADPVKKWAPYYFFQIYDAGVFVGRVIFRVGPVEELYYPGHVGYVIEEGARGHRYAERAVRLLLPFIARHQPAAWISCDEANRGSRRTVERLGGELIEIVDLPEWHDSYPLGVRRWCRYRLDAVSASRTGSR